MENHGAGSLATFVAAEFELAFVASILTFDFFNDLLLLLLLLITADILIDLFLIEVHEAARPKQLSLLLLLLEVSLDRRFFSLVKQHSFWGSLN